MMTERTRTRWLYLLIAIFILFSATYYVMGALSVYERFISSSSHRAQLPFSLNDDAAARINSITDQATQDGLRVGDKVLALNDQPFTGRNQLLKLAGGGSNAMQPGDTLSVVVSRDGGTTRTIPLHMVEAKRRGSASLFVFAGLNFLPPLICLLIGYWVVCARPNEWNAWLLLLLLSFPEVLFLTPTWWPGFWLIVLGVWYLTIQVLGPLALLLFGIYFPERWRVDVKVPWLKWLIIVPILVGLPTVFYLEVIQGFFAPDWGPLCSRLNLLANRTLNPLNLLCVLAYWAAVLDKLRSSATADARRRMRVVCAGSVIGLGSLLVIFILLPHVVRNLAQLQPLNLIGILLTLTFPLSLAYVVLVQRALDVRILLRMGTRYALARATLVILELAVGLFIVVRFLVPIFVRHQDLGVAIPVTIVVAAGLIKLFASRNSLTSRLQDWLDRRFFREAYDAEVVLSELSEQARGFTETGPLIETISRRISEVLHVAEVGVFLRGGGRFQLQQAVGLPAKGPLAFDEGSSTIRNLMRSKQPATLYRENPDGWFLLADEEERRTLDLLHAELLLPLAGRNRLLGIMTLGAKRSEEAYSPADLRLLQSVSTQAGLALEISELVRSLAQQATVRERMDRELEIAREVQERLFPQEIPAVAGLTLAGGCRAAQGVGGDYYDFLHMEDPASTVTRDGTLQNDHYARNGLIGIAIGDISGKGISAALLMASLRASLRGVTMDGSHDLARVMQKVNRLVYEASATNRYATFFFAIFDPATRNLRYVNAGHNSPIILRCPANLPQTILLEGGGPVVGLLEGALYEEQQITLEPGDLFIGYTDGISEAMTHDQQEWGEDRMIASAFQVWNCSASEILKCVFKDADLFTAGAPQHDDMTLLLMKLNATPNLSS